MTRTMRTVVAAAVAAIVVWPLLPAARAQVQTVDAEKLLAERFGFSTTDIEQARAGQAVTRLAPTREATEVGVFGAVRMDGSPDRLVYWLKDIAGFRKAAELGQSRKLSSPPGIDDFADLSLGDDELAALKSCRPGKCDLRLGDKAIARFQAEVDWAAPNAAAQANLLTRQIMVALAQAYLQGGDIALGTAHNEKTPRVAADEFRALLYQATNVYELARPFADYLGNFPAAPLPDSDQFLYWSHGGGGPEPVIALHQIVISHPPGGTVMIADKQLYASRFTDAALTIVTLASTSDGHGYYAIAGARARSTMLGGMTARLLRTRVERAAVDTVSMYLNWIQQSLGMVR